jgi:hypothetical protein
MTHLKTSKQKYFYILSHRPWNCIVTGPFCTLSFQINYVYRKCTAVYTGVYSPISSVTWGGVCLSTGFCYRQNSEGPDIVNGEWLDKWEERDSPYLC